MTVDRANQMISQSLLPGASYEQVEAWLAAQGIREGRPPGRIPDPPPEFLFVGSSEVDEPYYEIHDWEGYRIVSAAIEAGLRQGQFYRTIHIIYEDAARPLRKRLTIYLFFDADNRLLKHWVAESNAYPSV